jgi:hypothetical protein
MSQEENIKSSIIKKKLQAIVNEIEDDYEVRELEEEFEKQGRALQDYHNKFTEAMLEVISLKRMCAEYEKLSPIKLEACPECKGLGETNYALTYILEPEICTHCQGRGFLEVNK